MRAYGLRRNEVDNAFVRKGDYSRYGRSKTRYKTECKMIKSRARLESKKDISDELKNY